MAAFKWLVPRLQRWAKIFGLRDMISIFRFILEVTVRQAFKLIKKKTIILHVIALKCLEFSMWAMIWHEIFMVMSVITWSTEGRKKIMLQDWLKRQSNKSALLPKFYKLSRSSDNLLQINATCLLSEQKINNMVHFKCHVP